MPEPCKFLSLGSCQKRFLWTNKEVNLALHLDVGLVLQVGDAEIHSGDLWLSTVVQVTTGIGDPFVQGFAS